MLSWNILQYSANELTGYYVYSKVRENELSINRKAVVLGEDLLTDRNLLSGGVSLRGGGCRGRRHQQEGKTISSVEILALGWVRSMKTGSPTLSTYGGKRFAARCSEAGTGGLDSVHQKTGSVSCAQGSGSSRTRINPSSRGISSGWWLASRNLRMVSSGHSLGKRSLGQGTGGESGIRRGS